MTRPTHQWVGRIGGLDIEVAAVDAVTASVDLAVACLFTHEARKLSGGMRALDRALSHAPTRLRQEGVFTGALSTSMLVRQPPASIMARSVLVVGLGEPCEFSPRVLSYATRRAFDTAQLLEAQSIAFAPSILDAGLTPDQDDDLSHALIAGVADGVRAAHRLAALGLSSPSPLVCWRFAAGAAHLASAGAAFRQALLKSSDWLN